MVFKVYNSRFIVFSSSPICKIVGRLQNDQSLQSMVPSGVWSESFEDCLALAYVIILAIAAISVPWITGTSPVMTGEICFNSGR